MENMRLRTEQMKSYEANKAKNAITNSTNSNSSGKANVTTNTANSNAKPGGAARSPSPKNRAGVTGALGKPFGELEAPEARSQLIFFWRGPIGEVRRMKANLIKSQGGEPKTSRRGGTGTAGANPGRASDRSRSRAENDAAEGSDYRETDDNSRVYDSTNAHANDALGASGCASPSSGSGSGPGGDASGTFRGTEEDLMSEDPWSISGSRRGSEEI